MQKPLEGEGAAQEGINMTEWQELLQHIAKLGKLLCHYLSVKLHALY